MLSWSNCLRSSAQLARLNRFTNQPCRTLRMPSLNAVRNDEQKNDKQRFANLNKRYSRTKIGRVLLNRIYFRVEDYRSQKQLTQLIVSNRLVRNIRYKSFKKFHNLVILGPLGERQIKGCLVYLTGKLKNQEMSELNYQITERGKKKEDLFRIGLHYDESGRPKYGKWRNSMFPNLSNSQLAWSRFHRLLDAKMHNPKLCFDFSPIHQKSDLQKKQAFFNLQLVFSDNYKSKTPFNLSFTNYRDEYNWALRQILVERTLPHFVDLRNEFGDDLFSENRKLIVLLRSAGKTIERFDHTANYLLPLIGAKDHLDTRYESDLIKRLIGAPNVELVCARSWKDDLLGNGRDLNFMFHYQLLVLLRDGLCVRDSLRKAAKFHPTLQKV